MARNTRPEGEIIALHQVGVEDPIRYQVHQQLPDRSGPGKIVGIERCGARSFAVYVEEKPGPGAVRRRTDVLELGGDWRVEHAPE